VGVAARFGNTVLVHFEDMSYANLSRLFNQYRGSLACFSDDVQVCFSMLRTAACPHTTQILLSYPLFLPLSITQASQQGLPKPSLQCLACT
jgi:hypothetical protein